MNPPTISTLDIYLTGKCNYCCKYCYGENDSRGDMNLKTYEKALDFGHFISAKTIELCGGEPLVCKNFEKYSTLAREENFDLTLRTNGIFLDARFDFVAQNFKWVGISLDGLPEDNAEMRTSRKKISPEEQFQKPVVAIKELKKRNPKIKILLATLACKKNYSRLPDFARFLIDNHIPLDKWKIYEFIVDKFRSLINRELFEMTESEFKAVGEKILSVVGKKFEIQLQSAHTKRVSANCLIVSQNGDINLMGKYYGNVVATPFDKIINLLIEDNALEVISDNKFKTYSDKM